MLRARTVCVWVCALGIADCGARSRDAQKSEDSDRTPPTDGDDGTTAALGASAWVPTGRLTTSDDESGIHATAEPSTQLRRCSGSTGAAVALFWTLRRVR